MTTIVVIVMKLTHGQFTVGGKQEQVALQAVLRFCFLWRITGFFFYAHPAHTRRTRHSHDTRMEPERLRQAAASGRQRTTVSHRQWRYGCRRLVPGTAVCQVGQRLCGRYRHQDQLPVGWLQRRHEAGRSQDHRLWRFGRAIERRCAQSQRAGAISNRDWRRGARGQYRRPLIQRNGA